MPAMTVATGCGCIELRTSSFIIGYVDLVLSIICSTVMFLAVLGGAVIAVEGSNTDNLEELRMAEAITVISGITLVIFSPCMLVFTVTLLVGLHKNKRILVKVYLVAAFIFFLLDFVMFFVGFVHSNSTLSVAIRTIILVLEAYSLIVIRSYYYKMDESNKSNARYTTA